MNMYYNIIKRLEILYKLDFIESLRIKSNIKRGQVLIYKNCKTQLHSTAKIDTGNGVLAFNNKWSRNHPFSSLSVMAKNAVFKVNGEFSGAIIAVGSVVTKNVPKWTLVGGVSAKVIRTDVTWK